VLARVQGSRGLARPRGLRRALALLLLAIAVLAPAAAHARDPIVPLRDVHRGLLCTARTVVQGTEIASFDVQVLDVVADSDGTGARILVRVSGPAVAATGVAEGFSGSPVYCPDASGAIGNAGAISATVGQYGEDVALVTPIEQLLGLQVHPPSSVRSAPKLLRSARPLASPLIVAGLAPPLARVLVRAAAAHGRAIVSTPAGPLGTFAPQPLVPGASISAMLSSGAVSAGAIGTVTYRDGSTVYAFGHPLDGAGRRALPLGDGYVFAVIGNPLDTQDATSYKLAAPGHVLGTLSNDALVGIVGTVGTPPPTIPLTVTVRDRDRHRTLRQRTDVADETDVGNPDGSSALAQVAPVAVAQAVTTAFDGAPADETGQLCLHVSVRESAAPLRFCKRYVITDSISADSPPPLALAAMGDVSSALDKLDATRFARLHVTALTAGVTIERGLRLATILDVRGPRTVRPGHTARVALHVRVIHGPLRTIRFRLAVPPDAPLGPRTIRLTGTPVGPQGDLANVLDALSNLFGGGSSPRGAQSLAQLRASFALGGSYDGITAHIAGEPWPAYRDGRLRLDGSASLVVRVVVRHRRGRAASGPPPPGPLS
jgi:hypothetical protein